LNLNRPESKLHRHTRITYSVAQHLGTQMEEENTRPVAAVLLPTAGRLRVEVARHRRQRRRRRPGRARRRRGVHLHGRSCCAGREGSARVLVPRSLESVTARRGNRNGNPPGVSHIIHDQNRTGSAFFFCRLFYPAIQRIWL
jgi:hypothetical protein